MNTYKEYDLVKKCLLLIEVKLNWGKADNWHNDVFIELSEKIQEETNVLLSQTTLKRVWGKVNYANSPSISTLNALAKFAEFENWRDFKLNNSSKIIEESSWIKEKINPNIKIIATTSLIIALALVSLFSMTNSKKEVTLDTSKINFNSHVITNDIPNSVVFDFDLNNIKSDSIYIQQFWDETKTIKINSNQKQATGIYYYPGFFRAKLLIEGNIIKENDLFIKSKGWLATIDYTPIPKYIKGLKELVLDENQINQIKKNKEPLTSTFHLIDDFKEVSGDNFRLKTTIKNVYNQKWAVCQNASIIIVGTKSAIIVPFAITGCSSNIGIMMSDIYLDGKKNDLSSLTLDLAKETTIKIEVVNKELTVFAGERKLFSSSYNETIGRIVGLRYKFLGAGKVKDIKLSNLSENTIIIDK